jgi:hypothetical protein
MRFSLVVLPSSLLCTTIPIFACITYIASKATLQKAALCTKRDDFRRSCLAVVEISHRWCVTQVYCVQIITAHHPRISPGNMHFIDKM